MFDVGKNTLIKRLMDNSKKGEKLFATAVILIIKS